VSAETVLYSTLSGAAGVTALVSTRIYPDVAPQEGSLPAITFERTGTEYHNTIHGTVIATVAALDVWCMGATRASAEAVCDAATAAVAAAGFITRNRRAEYDPESDLWGAVLSIDHWAT